MKIYKYYFLDIDKPITVEAKSKHTARKVLEQVCNESNFKEKGYILTNLLRETSETLVADVSVKETKTGQVIWDGRGWSKKTTNN
jgi:hypothetical protein